MAYSYDRSAARIPPSLGVRSGYELRVIGFLSAVWPFVTEDKLDAAARGVDTMKRKHSDLWKGMVEVNLAPKEVADIIVSVALKETQGFKSGSVAATGFKEMAKKFVEKLVKGAEKDLKAFVAALPPQAQAWEKTKSHTESLPQRGQYGPYEVGVVYFTAGLKGAARPVEVNFTLKVVADLVNPSIEIGALSNNHTLEGLASRGTMKDAPARLNKALSFFKESLETEAKRIQQAPKKAEPESHEAWSVVTLGKSHGYALDVETYNSKGGAERAAQDQGNVYVVKGTQMWNEPLGQVEEHDRAAPYKFFP